MRTRTILISMFVLAFITVVGSYSVHQRYIALNTPTTTDMINDDNSFTEDFSNREIAMIGGKAQVQPLDSSTNSAKPMTPMTQPENQMTPAQRMMRAQMAAVTQIVTDILVKPVKYRPENAPKRPNFIPGGNVSADGPINSVPSRSVRKDLPRRSDIIENSKVN